MRKAKNDDLLAAVKFFQSVADDENADPEERRQSRAMLASYYGKEDGPPFTQPSARAQRPQLRVVPPPPTAADIQIARQAMDYAALSHEQRRALERLESRIGGNTASRAVHDRNTLVLKNMSPEDAAARVREMAKGATPQPIDVSAVANREFAARPYRGGKS